MKLKTLPLHPRDAADAGKATVEFAIVHHANQFIISEGYLNRSGIRSVVGSLSELRGLVYILELHRAYQVCANIHLSGTLLEAIAWHEPACLALFRDLYLAGLLEIVGSTYGQNIMRFFSHRHNVRQLNEGLESYRRHLGVDPSCVKSFWPPERVWDTRLMSPALRDDSLINGGFDFVFVDDRILYSDVGSPSPRHLHDLTSQWDPVLFHGYEIAGGHGLTALPIARNLRHCIPPRTPEDLRRIERQLTWIQGLNPAQHKADFLAVYGDDMEKPAAIGWDAAGPSQFETFLRWIKENGWVKPVKISDWAARARIAPSVVIEPGTYQELAVEFGAGEAYEKWMFDRRWDAYRAFFEWSECRVGCLSSLGANARLIALAEKHLLTSSWETAWHTPAGGAHGNVKSDGGPSGSSRAVASHSRHAAVIAEAAFWQSHKDGRSHCYFYDIDNDGEEELILKNERLFAVLSPQHGGRLIALFSVSGEDGFMVVGNPSDDWNLKEELNQYMDVPRNHPGALADVDYEHDSYQARIVVDEGLAGVKMVNVQQGSKASGLIKTVSLLSYEEDSLYIAYSLPPDLGGLEVECGLSPDYLGLLREGCGTLIPYEKSGARGWSTSRLSAWVKPNGGASFQWSRPDQALFGHGYVLKMAFQQRQFGLTVGVEISPEETAAESQVMEFTSSLSTA